MAPINGMDFARNQLLKYGWKEGKGLGKNESGIAKAIKPKLKFDTHGVGHDASEQFTYNWWEHAFNEAANNIRVSTTENGVTMELQDESIDITTKKYSLKKLKKKNPLEYGTFLKTSTLTQSGQMMRLTPDIQELEPKDTAAVCESLTDEELFRICGGRTAHKGARHGLKLNGKLARIEEQERTLLAQRKNKEKGRQHLENETQPEQTVEIQIEETETKITKKKKKSKRSGDEVCGIEHFQTLENKNDLLLDDDTKPLTVGVIKGKKVKKQLETEEIQELVPETVQYKTLKRKKKTEKRKWNKEDESSSKEVGNNDGKETYSSIPSPDTEISNIKVKKHKKTRRKSRILEEHTDIQEVCVNGIVKVIATELSSKKKRKALKVLEL